MVEQEEIRVSLPPEDEHPEDISQPIARLEEELMVTLAELPDDVARQKYVDNLVSRLNTETVHEALKKAVTQPDSRIS